MSASPGACLIAGCGDVGGRLARLLLARGQPVYGLRRNTSALPPSIRAINADLNATTLPALPGDLDSLVYLATPAARDRAGYVQTFCTALTRLLDALPQGAGALRRIVLASSSAVYGEHAGAWIDEDSACRPLAFNGEVLLAAEQALRATQPQACVLRLGGVYGPGRTQLIDAIRAGRASVSAGTPRYTNRIHADDAAGAIAHVLDLPQPQPLYNVVDTSPASQAEVYDWLAATLGVAAPARGERHRPHDVGNKRIGHARLLASGFRWAYPDYRAGYSALLGQSRGSVAVTAATRGA